MCNFETSHMQNPYHFFHSLEDLADLTRYKYSMKPSSASSDRPVASPHYQPNKSSELSAGRQRHERLLNIESKVKSN